MKKIPTLFVRDWDGDPKYVTREPNPDCDWVFAGLGRPTRKWDGTCVRYDGKLWWARREVKKDRPAPSGFVEIGHDTETGKRVGWEPAGQSSFWKHLEPAIGDRAWPEGTYELIGPRVNGNPEQWEEHALIPHGDDDLGEVPLDFDGLAGWLREHPWEGIVWHGPDGRMAKLKKRDMRDG